MLLFVLFFFYRVLLLMCDSYAALLASGLSDELYYSTAIPHQSTRLVAYNL
jgi:hypothetical protein